MRKAYGLWGKSSWVSRDKLHQWIRYAGAGSKGPVLEAAWHQYHTWALLGRGHCIPSTFRDGISGNGANMCFKSVVVPEKPTKKWLTKLKGKMNQAKAASDKKMTMQQRGRQ